MILAMAEEYNPFSLYGNSTILPSILETLVFRPYDIGVRFVVSFYYCSILQLLLALHLHINCLQM